MSSTQHSTIHQPHLRVRWHSFTLTSRFPHTRLQPRPNLPVPHTLFGLIRGLFLMAIDITLLLALTIFVYYCIAWCLIEPYERGFYCSDASIRNPLYANTVPSTMLLFITLALPLFIILIANALPVFFGSKEAGTGTNTPHWLNNIIEASTYVYLDYILGFFILTLLLDIVKCCVGRLRPNFVSMCQPDDMSVCDVDPFAYVPHVKCTSGWKRARNSRMSFPSGHAAAAVFFFIFTFHYLNQLYRKSPIFAVKVFRLFTISAIAVFTVYCCATRITDFWHFPTDVAGGIIFAIGMFYLTLRKYK